MNENIITVGWSKGEIDFGVNCAIEDLSNEQMKSVREMVCVAIGQAERMWAKGHNRRHPSHSELDQDLAPIEIPVKGLKIDCKEHGANQIVIKNGAGWCPVCLEQSNK